MQAWNRAIGSHASRFDQYYENIHIRHNIFEGLKQYALTPLKAKNTYIHHNVFENCKGGIRFLAVKDGKNARDLKGKERTTQAGQNLNIFQNRFIGEMSKDAIRIQSYNHIKHEDVVIAHNEFENQSQFVYLKDIENLFLANNIGIKFKKVNID